MNSFIGQFHPLLVHLPIGILAVALCFKLLSLGQNGTTYQAVLPQMVFIAFICSVLTVVTGYFLSLDGSYEDDILNYHKWSGIVLMTSTGLLYLLIRNNSSTRYQTSAWLVNGLLLFVTGHLGGTLTHGEGYLSFGTPTYTKPIIDTLEKANVYTDVIEPIFAQKCWSCHSSGKQKGGLRLDDIQYVLKGGKHGAVVEEQAEKSKLVRRMALPENEDEHMPPAGKPQPTDAEINLITWWINNGAPVDKKIDQLQVSPEIKTLLEELVDEQVDTKSNDIPTATIAAAPVATLKALQSYGINVLPLGQNTNYLQVHLNRKNLESAQWKLLQEIGNHIVWLNANHITLTDTVTQSISSFKNLIKLDLSHSDLQNKPLHFLSGALRLQSLNLSHTSCDAEQLATLGKLENLKNVYLFETKVSATYIQAMKINFPLMQIDTGHYAVPTYRGDTSELTYEEFYKAQKTNIDSISGRTNAN